MRKILVSQCLYGGEPVRYDGKTKEEKDPRFLKWKEEGRLIPVCPEVFGGLPTPRADAQRVGDKVIARTGKDVTGEYMKGAHEAVCLAKEHDVICALMKEKSPSCGSTRIYDGNFDGTLIPGQGTAVELLRKAGVRVFSEEELDDVEGLLKSHMFDGKKVIIFDMDGTLIDSVGIWNEVDRKLIEKLRMADAVTGAENNSYEPSDEDIQRRRDDALRKNKSAPNPYEEYCRILKESYGMKESIQEIIRIRYDIAQHYLKNVISYKPGAAELIKKLKAAGMTLVIASTTKKSNMDVYRTENVNICNKASIDEYFTRIYTREDVEQIKPSPDVYLAVMEDMGAKPSDCLVFEDSLVGVEAAKAAGIETVAVYDKYSDGEMDQIQNLANYVIRDYWEIMRER